MQYHVTIGSRMLVVELDGDTVRVDGAELAHAELRAVPGTVVRHLTGTGISSTVVARPAAGGWDLHVDGWPVYAAVIDERTRAIQAMTGRSAAASGPRPVRAPMPGLVVRVEVEVGAAVQPGQPVIAMEAMKMENELKAESAGIVAKLLVEPGQAVQKGDLLVEFEAQT